MDENNQSLEQQPEVTNEGQIQQAEEQPAPVPSEQKPTEESGELPETASDRTKLEFEKLKEANKRLKAELDSKNKSDYGNVFESLYGKPQTQQVADIPTYPRQEVVQPQNFVDENGYVDTNKLNQAWMEANKKAERAETEARQTREYLRQAEEKRQVKEAHEKYPWLNPSNQDQFDRASFELVRDRLVRSMWEGKEQSLAEVAEEISKFRQPSVKPEVLKEQVATELKEKQAQKAQASAVQMGKGQPRGEITRSDELREKTRRGDQSALDERLKKLTY